MQKCYRLILSCLFYLLLESETSSPDKGHLKNSCVGNIKPHEQRALNFLINEYLLLYGYKLTSITFADENQNQVMAFIIEMLSHT